MTNQWPDEHNRQLRAQGGDNCDAKRRQIEAWIDELETTYEEKIDALAEDLAEALALLRLVCTFADDGEAYKRCAALLEKHKEKP